MEETNESYAKEIDAHTGEDRVTGAGHAVRKLEDSAGPGHRAGHIHTDGGGEDGKYLAAAGGIPVFRASTDAVGLVRKQSGDRECERDGQGRTVHERDCGGFETAHTAERKHDGTAPGRD